jgi:tetratricopeptide (TPR) repeat protein
MIERETAEALAHGETTIAELEGLTAAEAYAIADFGWMLLEQGRADTAAVVFETLALANPRHAYFHALHGAALQRTGAVAGALEAYARAIAADPDETSAMVNRAELLLAEGAAIDEAGLLLERALGLDPAGVRPETHRARAIVADLAREADTPGRARPE